MEDCFNETLESRYKKYGDNIHWTMRDGTNIKLKDMEDSHIKNSMNMLIRNKRDTYWITIFKDELLKRRIRKIKKVLNTIK